jgi:hypothetical protein
MWLVVSRIALRGKGSVMAKEPVSWLVIEPGWAVVDRAREPAGEVREVVGDPDADVFDGLRITTPGGHERYVAGERVARITEGTVELDVRADDLGTAYAGEPPGGAEVRPDRSAEP